MTATEAAPPKPLLTIRPGATPIRRYVLDLWHHRDLLGVLASRDVKLRYRQTVLGVTWVVLQPLLAAGILSFIFGRVAHLPADGLPFFVFSFGGMLGWNAFSNTLTRASTSLVVSSALVAKIFFPRLILPLSTAAGAFLDFIVTLVVLTILLATNDITPGVQVLLMPVWLVLLLMLGLGIGFVLAALSVTYRDIPQITPVAIQLLLYLSPVAYASSAIPGRYQLLYHLNPVAGLIEGFRWSVLGTSAPEGRYVAYSAVVAVVSFVAGAIVLERNERRFADVV